MVPNRDERIAVQLDCASQSDTDERIVVHSLTSLLTQFDCVIECVGLSES
jgi:hypothetical protein